MPRPRGGAFCRILLVMAFLATSAAAQQKTEGRPLSQGEGEGNMSVLAGLRPGHPRLIALAEDWPRLQQLLTSNPELRAIRDSLQERAVRILEEPTVEHTLIGPRLLQESRRCLERVYTLAAMYRLTGEARFAERARKEMLAAAAFPDWNPSHFLDTAEMTHALAIGYDWLYDELGPEDRATIRQAIIEKGLEPAVACYHEKRWWVTSDFNWNQVCNGGIGIGALALADEEPDVAGYILTQALESLPLAMASYAPDGGWAEGPGYWHYATSYNVYLLAAFETALGSDRKLSALPGFDRTGFFRIYFVSPTGRTFNYADAGEQAGSAPEMFWLARTFRQPLFAWHQREHRGRRPSVLDLLWYRPEGEGPVASGLPLDACFTGIDVTFLRSAWEDREAIFLGCKGGDNQANHSHLDLGSFVLDAGGYRWAVDLGPDDYNLPDYFGGKRFTYYRLRTESHNTLTFADENQDPAAKAPIIGFGSNPGRAWAVADLSAPYAQWAKRARRGVALLARRQVLIQDEVDVKGDVGFSWRMLTPAEVTVADDRAVLAQGDWRLEARILAPSGLRFEVAAASAPPPQAQQPNVRVLSIRLPGRAGETRLAVLLTPYRQGEEAPGGTVALTPLDEWPGLTR